MRRYLARIKHLRELRQCFKEIRKIQNTKKKSMEDGKSPLSNITNAINGMVVVLSIAVICFAISKLIFGLQINKDIYFWAAVIYIAFVVAFIIVALINRRSPEYIESDPKQTNNNRMIAVDQALEQFAKNHGYKNSWESWLYFYNNGYPLSIGKAIFIAAANAHMSFILVVDSPAPDNNLILIIGLLLINLLVAVILTSAANAIHSIGFEKDLMRDYPKWKLHSGQFYGEKR